MDEALADYQKAAQLMPPRSFWDEVDQSTIATILKNRGDIDGAIAIYDKLIRLWPQKSKVYPFGTGAYYEQRALLLVQQKRYDEAIADYEKIKIMQPQSATQIEAEIAKLNTLKAP
jgi:tetratricopeptide (TPR) repeat protein